MKSKIILCLALVLTGGWFDCAKAQAQDFTYTTNNGTITVMNYTGPGGALDIPGTITGLPVTMIESNAFLSCSGLTSVTIPNSVISIGRAAFLGCPILTSVTIPNSVTNIGDDTFRLCKSLTSMTIGTGVTSIGDGALWDCASLTTVTIPGNVTRIGDDAFVLCTSLARVTISPGVTSIGSAAFLAAHACRASRFRTASPTSGTGSSFLAPV